MEKCVVTGGVNYKTFDRAVISFPGTCVYTLAKSCTEDEKIPKFNVEVKINVFLYIAVILLAF